MIFIRFEFSQVFQKPESTRSFVEKNIGRQKLFYRPSCRKSYTGQNVFPQGFCSKGIFLLYFILKTQVIFKALPPEAATGDVVQENLVLEISQILQESTCARVTLLKKRLWHRGFPVNFAKFLRTLSEQFLYKTPLGNCFCTSYKRKIFLT